MQQTRAIAYTIIKKFNKNEFYKFLLLKCQSCTLDLYSIPLEVVFST